MALDGRAVVITGRSGSGKSALALRLMALGADLVADDRTDLERVAGGGLRARCPAAISGLIEARGVGVLRCEAVAAAWVVLVVDLDNPETERLPPQRNTSLLEQSVPLLRRVEGDHFPAAILQYLKGGRSA